MLDNLQIRNIALIDEAFIDFGKGLNILSGETGAGKSMIIDSVIFLLGGRATKDIIRVGADKATVTGIFNIQNTETVKSLEDVGVIVEPDGNLLLMRSINTEGKSVCRINGQAATVGMLKQAAEFLIDIHGQHEHQSLLNPSKHIIQLDKFCAAELEPQKELLSSAYKQYRSIVKSMSSLSGDERERRHKIDLLQFQVNEIEAAKLYPDEDVDLIEKRKILSSYERLSSYVDEILSLLYEDDDDDSALDKISKGITQLSHVCELDKAMEESLSRLESVSAELDDITRDIRLYFGNLESDPRELYRLEKRLDLIYSLKRKYGNSVSEILDYYKKTQEQLEFIKNSEQEIIRLQIEKDKYESQIVQLCDKITQIRQQNALIIQSKIGETLHELGMKDAKFKILISKKKDFTANGQDDVEFLISANVGEELKPMSKIASGGEMSRVMLALKTVLTDKNENSTFIFDEIDTGVSGRTAQMVAEKLALIATDNQILCITHLPQIAAMADNHFLIEKTSTLEKTITNVTNMDDTEIISELARLTGGAKITKSTLKSAAEMKDLAATLKKSIRQL